MPDRALRRLGRIGRLRSGRGHVVESGGVRPRVAGPPAAGVADPGGARPPLRASASGPYATSRAARSACPGWPRCGPSRTRSGSTREERAAFVALAGVGVEHRRVRSRWADPGRAVPPGGSRRRRRRAHRADRPPRRTGSSRSPAWPGSARPGSHWPPTLALSGAPWRTWWVPLAPVGESSFILDAVAEAIGAPTATLDGLGAWLGSAPALLAIDNVEHLQEAGEVLAELLREVPSLSVLLDQPRAAGRARRARVARTTARRAAGAAGRRGRRRRAAASVELLVERVQATVPDFVADRDRGRRTWPRSAARSTVFRSRSSSPPASGGCSGRAACSRRSRRTRSTCTTSAAAGSPCTPRCGARCTPATRLLTAEERQTFQCLSVFRGGWTVAAAAQVAASDAVVDHLDRLIALGLVEASRPGPGRAAVHRC